MRWGSPTRSPTSDLLTPFTQLFPHVCARLRYPDGEWTSFLLLVFVVVSDEKASAIACLEGWNSSHWATPAKMLILSKNISIRRLQKTVGRVDSCRLNSDSSSMSLNFKTPTFELVDILLIQTNRRHSSHLRSAASFRHRKCICRSADTHRSASLLMLCGHKMGM